MAPEQPGTHWSSAEEEIMEATYRALGEHGYAELSISRIAAELDKSKAALYYHYDTKDDLLVAFLQFAIDRFETTIETETGDAPAEDLEHIIEKLLPLQLDEERQQLQTVLTGLRSQAVTNEEFREQFTQIDERLATTIREIVESGIEDGTFCDVDSSRVAEHILATINGAKYGRATTDRRGATAAARVSLASYIDTELRRH
ncbi:TetR/AcrR family transcriptional regulator [Halorhabdus sp. CBA1104]|uniref:TetR/AcrR family transcriptional regulator n=1 Tax=unclassified Halorhabdus TaxID=2621901 RepID=UPI0012B42C39|nr:MULTISPECIES: TetR/AcrR family transcriptional regulator [unclassified Halorhabdus]QGN07235.1 TetR/AcrR family transcriptional regulator [Halorhabdus sp. CBA1104]